MLKAKEAGGIFVNVSVNVVTIISAMKI